MMVVGGHSVIAPITELWDLNSRQIQIIDPMLPVDTYVTPGLFLVDEGFCSKK